MIRVFWRRTKLGEPELRPKIEKQPIILWPLFVDFSTILKVVLLGKCLPIFPLFSTPFFFGVLAVFSLIFSLVFSHYFYSIFSKLSLTFSLLFPPLFFLLQDMLTLCFSPFFPSFSLSLMGMERPPFIGANPNLKVQIWNFKIEKEKKGVEIQISN